MNINQWLDYPKDQVVICDHKNQTTVADLSLRVAYIQSVLIEKNISTCAIYSNDTTLFLATLLACACSNITVILPANNTPDFIQLSKADCYVGDFDNAIEFEIDGLQTSPQLLSDSCQVDIFTSGSTGTPKCISRSIDQLLLEVTTLQQTWGDSVNDALFISTVSQQHIYGLLFKVLWPLLSHNKLWQSTVPFEESIDGLAPQYSRLVLISSPAFLKRINDQHNHQGHLIKAFSSGGVLSDELQEMAEFKLQTHITQVYGSSETGGIAYRQVKQQWQLLDQVSIKTIDNVLWVKSPYCHQNDWLCTEDLVKVTDQGFDLLGRNDRIVKIEEKRISLAQVEHLLMQLEYVHDTAVIAMDNGRQYLAAAIILNDYGKQLLAEIGAKEIKRKIKVRLREQLEQLAIPRQLRFVDEGLENSQGKRVVAELMGIFQ